MGRSRSHLRWRGVHVGVVHLQPRPFGHGTLRGTQGGRRATVLVSFVRNAGCRGVGGSTSMTVPYKRSRFSTRLPAGYLYTPSHYWLRQSEPGVWQIGFTKFASRMLGEIVEFDFKVPSGAPIETGQVIGWTEGFKAM